jgi:hypothetical protein
MRAELVIEAITVGTGDASKNIANQCVAVAVSASVSHEGASLALG